MATHSSILPEESCGQRSLEGYSPWGHRQSDMTENVCFTCDLGINNGAASSLSFSKAQNSLEASSAFTRPPESFPASSVLRS